MYAFTTTSILPYIPYLQGTDTFTITAMQTHIPLCGPIQLRALAASSSL